MLGITWTAQAKRFSQGEIEKVILNPKYHEPLVLLKAIRNGLVYGVKVRFPHALVMIFLFRSGTVREKLLAIFKATRLHAFNLAKFALLYKSSMLAMKNVNGKEQSVHPFLAGLFGGYWVFGHGKAAFSSVSQQIVIYVFARVVLGMAKLAVQPPGDNTLIGGAYGGHGGKGILGLSPEQLAIVRQRSWPVFASLSWASVMWMFRWYPEMLQPSLRNSMTYMYVRRFFPPLFRIRSMSGSRPGCLAAFPTDTGLTSTSLAQIQQRGQLGRLGQFHLAQQMILLRFYDIFGYPLYIHLHITVLLRMSRGQLLWHD
jgi:peroxisomal membrane protein 4